MYALVLKWIWIWNAGEAADSVTQPILVRLEYDVDYEKEFYGFGLITDYSKHPLNHLFTNPGKCTW